MDRIRELAATEGRSLNQQAIVLLERAVAEQPDSFGTAYRQFREPRGPSPLDADALDGFRDKETGSRFGEDPFSAC